MKKYLMMVILGSLTAVSAFGSGIDSKDYASIVLDEYVQVKVQDWRENMQGNEVKYRLPFKPWKK